MRVLFEHVKNCHFVRIILKNSNNSCIVFEHVKITSLKYNLPIRVVTILTILFIQYCIIIGYNNVETWVQYSGAEFCHKTMYFK